MFDLINFRRITIVSACSILSQYLGHSDIDKFALEVALENIIIGKNLQDKANKLAKYSIDNPLEKVFTVDGEVSLQEAIVIKAIQAFPAYRENETWQKLERGLFLDGFVIEKIGEVPHPYNCSINIEKYALKRMYPEDIPQLDLPEAESEIYTLMGKYGFNLALSHLKNAINDYSAGRWPQANGEIRKSVEELLDEITSKLCPLGISKCKSSSEKRDLLTKEMAFLSQDLNEYRFDNKPSFIRGLISRLHPEGGHSGLSNEDDCTFRIHIVLITIRLILRRYGKILKEKVNG